MTAYVSYIDPRRIVRQAEYYQPAGVVESLPLPCEFVEGVRLDRHAVAADLTETLPLAVEMVRRMVPWCDVITAPMLLVECEEGTDPLTPVHMREGRRFYVVGGIYLHSPSPTIVLAASHPPRLLALACHESWHAIERHLPPEIVQAIDDHLAAPAFGAGHSYWSNGGERRARAFEAWCARLIEGMPATFPASDPIQSVFAGVWSGEIGEKLLSREFSSSQAAKINE